MSPKELSSALRTVITGLHKGLRKQISPANIYSMTEMETIGFLIRHERLLPSELAVLARVKTQSMSQIINKMQELGMVKRTPAKDDKRKVYVSLTPAGKKMVERTRYERDEWLQKAIETHLVDKEQTQLSKAIPILNKLLARV